jgi:hypothetical protein
MAEYVSLHNFSYDWRVLAIWLSQKNVLRWRFSGKSECSKSIHNKVDPKHLNSVQRRTFQNNRSKENNEHCSNIDRQLELKEFSDIIVDVSSVSESNDDRTEVVIKKDNIRSIFGNICTAYIHGETDISLCQSRSIV